MPSSMIESHDRKESKNQRWEERPVNTARLFFRFFLKFTSHKGHTNISSWKFEKNFECKEVYGLGLYIRNVLFEVFLLSS